MTRHKKRTAAAILFLEKLVVTNIFLTLRKTPQSGVINRSQPVVPRRSLVFY